MCGKHVVVCMAAGQSCHAVLVGRSMALGQSMCSSSAPWPWVDVLDDRKDKGMLLQQEVDQIASLACIFSKSSLSSYSNQRMNHHTDSMGCFGSKNKEEAEPIMRQSSVSSIAPADPTTLRVQQLEQRRKEGMRGYDTGEVDK